METSAGRSFMRPAHFKTSPQLTGEGEASQQVCASFVERAQLEDSLPRVGIGWLRRPLVEPLRVRVATAWLPLSIGVRSAVVLSRASGVAGAAGTAAKNVPACALLRGRALEASPPRRRGVRACLFKWLSLSHTRRRAAWHKRRRKIGSEDVSGNRGPNA